MYIYTYIYIYIETVKAGTTRTANTTSSKVSTMYTRVPEFMVYSPRASHPSQECFGAYTDMHHLWLLYNVRRAFLEIWEEVDIEE